MSSGAAGSVERVDEHLSALDAAVDGLLGDRLTGLSNDDIVHVLQRLERSMRKLVAADQQVLVESAERSLHAVFDVRSPVEFLVTTVRISESQAQ
ncbi:HNH endonuclease, partial [Rhodococcus sp. NPDC054953]